MAPTTRARVASLGMPARVPFSTPALFLLVVVSFTVALPLSSSALHSVRSSGTSSSHSSNGGGRNGVRTVRRSVVEAAGGGGSQFASLKLFVNRLTVPLMVRVLKDANVNVTAYKIRQKFHRDLPPAWAYAFGTSRATAAVPGPTIVSYRNQRIFVTWRTNIMDTQHMLPVDNTLGMPRPNPPGVPLSVHVHGAHVESYSDGHPDAWQTARGAVGSTFVKRRHTYVNQQPGSTMWYHDHTAAMTRLNMVAGLAGFFIILDAAKERELNLPAGRYDVPLMIQDKSFTKDGQIYFPAVGPNPGVHPAWTPEYFGDYNLVNGKVSPYMPVQRRKYRFRLLNAANARYYVLRMRAYAKGKKPSLMPFTMVASDGGFLARPLQMKRLTLGPAERVEIVIDFGSLPSGASIRVVNDGGSPYPDGDPPTPAQRQVMLFVVRGPPPVPDLSRIPPVLATIPPIDVRRAVNYPLGRLISLSEYENDFTTAPMLSLLESKGWREPVTVTPRFGDTEIWTLINLTKDTHSFHIHFTPHRIISRRPFNAEQYRTAGCTLLDNSCYTGPPLLPGAHEAGWKDTTAVPAGYITRLLVKFDPWEGAPLPFDPTKGPGYVFHCHMLDHEDNDMMRPFIILPKRTGAARS